MTTVRELLVRGATVDLRDAQGHTPEDLARQLQRLDILKQMKAWTSGKEDRQQPDGVEAASEPLQKLTIESNDSIASRSMEEVRGLDELSLRRRALQCKLVKSWLRIVKNRTYKLKCLLRITYHCLWVANDSLLLALNHTTHYHPHTLYCTLNLGTCTHGVRKS